MRRQIQKGKEIAGQHRSGPSIGAEEGGWEFYLQGVKNRAFGRWGQSLYMYILHPGEGTYCGERLTFLEPFTVNWRFLRGKENGESLDLSFPLTCTPTMKLPCMILPWWIRVIRPL